MIRLCTCSGESASASDLKPSRKRVVLASCKICGGNPLVDGSGSLSGSMLSTVGPELTSAINPDLTWKTISKGNRSASRRARKPIARGLKGSVDLVNKDPKRVEMSVSESEKLGVSVLGRRFSDKVEHVPIKKRRFFFRSPSPPPQMPSPRLEEPEWCVKSQPASGHDSSLNSIAKQRVMTIESAVANELSEVVSDEIVVDEKNSEEIHEKFDDNEDFSGISILAAAACNNSIESGAGNVEEGSTAEDSFVQEGSSEVLVNTESCSMAKESFKEQSLNCAEISNDGTDSCVSVLPVEETAVSFETTYSSPKNKAMVCDALDGKNMGRPCSDNSVALSGNPSSGKDDGTLKRLESSSRDDRSHWDLNIVMDAWDNPCEDPILNSQTITVNGMSENCLDSEKVEKLEREPGVFHTKYAIERTVQPMVGEDASVDVHEDVCRLPDMRSLVPRTDKSNREQHNLDAFKAPDKPARCQEGAPNNVMNLAKETKPVHNPERNSSNAETVVSAATGHTLAPTKLVNTCSVPDAMASPQWVSFDTRETSGTVSSHQVGSEGAYIDRSCSGAEHITSKLMSEERTNEGSPVDIGEQIGDGCDADAQSGETIICLSPQVEKPNVVVPDVAISNNASDYDVDTDKKANLLLVGHAYKKMNMDIRTGQQDPQPGHFDYAMGKSDKVGPSQVSTNCEELSVFGASFGKNVPVAEMKVQDCNVSLADDKYLNTTELESSGHIDSETFTHKSHGQTPGLVDTPMTIGDLNSHDVCRSYGDDPVNCSGKIALKGDASSDSDCDSHNDPGPLFEAEKKSELQAGYDSQFEDGELRDSDEHGWEEDVGDEGEAERVDYGSDNRDPYVFETAADIPTSIAVQIEGVRYRKERSTEIDRIYNGGDQVKEKSEQKDNCQPCVGSSLNTFQSASSRMKLFGWGQLSECKSPADVIMVNSDESNKKNHAGPHIDALVSRDFKTGVSRRELSSCIVGPTASDVLLRKDAACIEGTRSNNFNDSNPRYERDAGSVKSIGRGGSSSHSNGRGRGSAHWVDSSGRHWGQNHRHSPSYYGSADFVHPGPKNAAAKLESSGFLVVADGTIVKAGSTGPSDQIHRQSVNGSSDGVRRSLTRRGSPADMDEAFGMHTGLGPGGERRPDRSITVVRGRSGRYGPRMVGMGPRERYHGSAPNDWVGSSLRMQHPSARRERSFSPIQRRGAPHLSRSSTRSQSRSRTRSPHMRPSPRGRNGCGPGLRQCSASPPNSRPEARMDRVRSPHRRPGFGEADHMVAFSSTPRSRGSPPHTSRWIDDRKHAAKHLREHGYKQQYSVSERSSPRRFFGRSHRLDLGDSLRPRPDEYYRPMHSSRFPRMVGADRGRPRCNASDDDKRNRSDRYGIVHPVRHYDKDGTVKRFQYDVSDGFAAHNSRNRDSSGLHAKGGLKDFVEGIDSRLGDAPRSAREDKGHFTYGREGKYTANSKSFGMREFDEDIAPRRRRPS